MNIDKIILHKSYFFKNEIDVFKYKFLLSYSLLSLIPMTIFISKYLFDFQKGSLLSLSFMCTLFIILVFSVFLQRFYGEFNRPAIMSLASTTLIGVYMILLVGGLGAPGYFWMSLMSLSFGVLFGSRGCLLGGALSLLYMIVLVLLDMWGYNYTLIPTQEMFISEKRLNIILFSIFVALIAYSFCYLNERARDTIDKRKKEVEEILKIIVHDINNPILILSAKLMLLEKQGLIKSTELDVLKRATHSIEGLTSSIREMLRNDIVINQKDLEKINLLFAIRSSMTMLSEISLTKNVDIVLETDEKEINILGDLKILEFQVFNNLLSNAIKFSPEGSSIYIRLAIKDNFVVICIEDSGIGITKSDLETIFDVKPGKSRIGLEGQRGSGFGLNIVKRFVESFNGTIEIESCTDTLDHGTKIYLKFPIL